MMKLKAAISLPELLQQAGETHQRLIALVESVLVDEVGLETRFRKRLRLDTYSHYPLHTQSIREWREQKEKRDSL